MTYRTKAGYLPTDKNLRMFSNLEVVATHRDGECFIRMNRHSTKHKNPYAFGLKIYPGDALDERYNTTLPNGHAVITGVEVDSWGEPLFYHFKKKSKTTMAANPWGWSTEHTRIPARDIIHLRMNIDEEEEVYRGFPTIIECLDKFHVLNKYDEAELVAARDAACAVDTYSRDSAILSDDDEVADFDTVRGAMAHREPGMSRISPEGWKINTDTPSRPNQAYEAFHKANLRELSCGMLVDYNTLSNDMESISWSSLRENKLATTDVYKLMQRLSIDVAMRPIFDAWLINFLNGPLTNLPAAKYEKFRQHTWLARRWQWVNPSQEAKANVEARDHGWKTDADIAAEMGKDYSENVAKIKMMGASVKGTFLEDNYATEAEKQPDST